MYHSTVTVPPRTYISASVVVLVFVMISTMRFVAPAAHIPAINNKTAVDSASLPPVTPLVFDNDLESAPTQTGAAALAELPVHIFNFLYPVKENRAHAELFAYGNTLGALLQTFSNEHHNLTDTLEAHARARTDMRAAAALVALASEYAELGGSIAQIAAPQSVAALSASLADSYRAIGTHLRAVAGSSDDASFLTAIEKQNHNADRLVRSLASLSALFQANGVQFSASDAGKVLVGDEGY